MTYLLAGAVILASIILVACTLIKVDVSSDDEGTTTIQPNGINVTVNKEGQATGKAQQP
jgi:hypothetical protein